MEIGKLLFIRRLRELATLIRMIKQGEAAVAADGWTKGITLTVIPLVGQRDRRRWWTVIGQLDIYVDRNRQMLNNRCCRTTCRRLRRSVTTKILALRCHHLRTPGGPFDHISISCPYPPRANLSVTRRINTLLSHGYLSLSSTHLISFQYRGI